MFEEEKNENNIGNEQNGSSNVGYGQWNNTPTYGSGTYSGQNNSYRSQGNYSGTGTGYNQNYSYGQNSYTYGQNSQPVYGTYQYNSTNTTAPQQPIKKKHTAAKVIAAICIVALLVGSVGAGYTLYRRSGSNIIEEAIENHQEVKEDTEEVASAESKETVEEKSGGEIKTTTVTGETKAVVTDVTAVVEDVMPAMVIIHNNYTTSASYFGYVQKEEATASGSGIIVGENDSELLIATNYHVVEGADSLEVIFADDTAIEAVVKGTDSTMDLAVVAVMLDDISSDTKDAIKIATLGDSDSLKLGEPAIAIGNALGYGQSVTTGVISAVNREVEMTEGTPHTFIQTDAAINPGNSGGALLNLSGEVIGINSNKIGGNTVEGMGYAIPISLAQPIIDKLMNERTLIKVSSEERGYIGISGVSVTSDVSEYYGIPVGVYVAEITDGGGAEDAGIKKGDVITEFDGEEITSMDDLQTRLQYYAAGTTVTVKVMRQTGEEYAEKEYTVTLGKMAKTSKDEDSNGSSGQYEDSKNHNSHDDGENDHQKEEGSSGH